MEEKCELMESTKNDKTDAEKTENCEKEQALTKMLDKNNDIENITQSKHEIGTNVFKTPDVIIGPRKDKHSKVKKNVQLKNENHENQNNESSEEINDIKKIVIEEQKEESEELILDSTKSKQIVLPYKEPPWSGMPTKEYKAEVLKSGIIIETINFSCKSFYVVGRLLNCDVSLAHPTISRYHAILQHRTTADKDNDLGLYLYDLGSTHGTFLNGNRVKPNMYIKIHAGYMIKFGCSQRKFIFQTPPEDEEAESELTFSELKEKRRQKLEELEKKNILDQPGEETVENMITEKETSEGIDWGMGEDADEDTDLRENPFAQTNNEELFLDDPKKTLRGWFEREGYDLQYQTEERGIGQFLCWIDLPIENVIGKSLKVEVLVKGKKKEAVVQCALEACRTLDRYGLLRQSSHEGRKRKSRNWEEEDYYDSDEDNFLDRTGTIERKRKRRMRIAGKLNSETETYDSLVEKLTNVSKQISEIESKLNKARSVKSALTDTDEDALDAFMNTLNSNTLDKGEVIKLKIDLNHLRKEEAQLLKLIDIAKPARLPSLQSTNSSNSYNTKQKLNLKTETSEKCKENLVEYSKEIMLSDKKCGSNADDHVVGQEDNLKKITSDQKESNIEIKKSNTQNKTTTFIDDTSTELVEFNVKSSDTINRTHEEKNIQRNTQCSTMSPKTLDKNTKNKKSKVPCNEDQNLCNDNYSTWVPPSDQSGDGRTSLNDKYGY